MKSFVKYIHNAFRISAFVLVFLMQLSRNLRGLNINPYFIFAPLYIYYLSTLSTSPPRRWQLNMKCPHLPHILTDSNIVSQHRCFTSTDNMLHHLIFIFYNIKGNFGMSGRCCSRSPFRCSTGNNVSVPLFSPFFFSITTYFNIMAKQIKNTI